MTLSLAFLAPEMVKAAVEGCLPLGFGLKRLVDLPMAWPDQWRALGLQAPTRTRDELAANSNSGTEICGQRLSTASARAFFRTRSIDATASSAS